MLCVINIVMLLLLLLPLYSQQDETINTKTGFRHQLKKKETKSDENIFKKVNK